MSRTLLALRNHTPRHFSLQKVYPKRAYASHKSTVHRGNAFEERSLKILEQTMSMSLKRVGGKEDGGIDLLGWWWLPLDSCVTNSNSSSSSEESQSSFGGTPNDMTKRQRRRIRIIGQCKAEKKKMGPGYVRELEGVLYRLMALSSSSSMSTLSSSGGEEELGNGTTTNKIIGSQYQIPMVALLISESPFTKSALLRAHSSPIPFFLLHLPPLEGDAPDIQTVGSSNDDLLASANANANANANNPPTHPPTLVGSLGSAVCNPALSGAQGLLMGQLEVRWERSFSADQQQPLGRPALWWKNERLQSFTPDDYDGQGEEISSSATTTTTTTVIASSTSSVTADKIVK